ncbi:MAG: alkaline phosphatase PhoX, partial [Geodermatophilaceae bacterium]
MVDSSPRPALSRRSFLNRSAATGLGVTLAGTIDGIFGSAASASADVEAAGYGPLVADADGLLSLPPGFSYTVVAQEGVTLLDSGEPTPGAPDGTASFSRRGGDGVVLVNNHEVAYDGDAAPVPHLAGLVYDRGSFGGTTNIEVDSEGNRVREYVSLAGTENNCAGGPTPWHTWLTCEETEDVPGPDNPLQKRHGYVFEVDPQYPDNNQDPQPIKALGRYPHEAVAVDPNEGVLYLTEDASGPLGLLYRFTPPRSALPLGRGSLRKLGPTDGKLEAMRAYT